MTTGTANTPTTAADPTRVVCDLELLQRFFDQKLQGERRDQPLEEFLAEFQRYRASIDRLRDEVRPALERSLRGEYGEELNVEDIIGRGLQKGASNDGLCLDGSEPGSPVGQALRA